MSNEPSIILRDVTKTYGSVDAVHDVSLAFDAGSYVVLLGPSGSGKTTLLSIIGGFTAPTAGQILVDGQDVTLTPPAKRPTATVFQDYALFPHMTVAENVGFGLTVRGASKASVAARVKEELSLVGLDGFGDRRITEASGGQRQRIALARALVTDPAILLLDEPLGALDLNLRRQMQDELRALQRREGRTFVHVTHDQEEAMAIADMIVIMKDGEVEDSGAPQDVYARPRSRFSAQFMGESNILDARPKDGLAETEFGRLPVIGTGAAGVAIRPEKLSLAATDGGQLLGRATLEAVVFQGSFARVTTRIGQTSLTMRVPPQDLPNPDATVEVFLQPGGATALER